MTIAFRAGAHSGANSVTSVTVTKPSGTANGDGLLAVFAVNSQSGIPTVTPPSGWTELAHMNNTGQDCYLLAKTAASEGSNYVWTWSGAKNASAAIGCWSAFSAFDQTSAAVHTAASTRDTAPGTITFDSNEMLIGLFAGGGNASAYTAPTGMTARVTHTGTSTGPNLLIAEVFLSHATATGDKTATLPTSLVSFGALVGLIGDTSSPQDPYTVGFVSIGDD